MRERFLESSWVTYSFTKVAWERTLMFQTSWSMFFFSGYQCSCSRSQFGMFASFRSIAMCGITYPTKSSKGGGLAWTQLHFISIGGDGYQTLFGSWVLKQKGFLTERWSSTSSYVYDKCDDLWWYFCNRYECKPEEARRHWTRNQNRT